MILRLNIETRKILTGIWILHSKCAMKLAPIMSQSNLQLNIVNIKLPHLTYFHLNCRGLSANWNSFKELMCDIQNDNVKFDYIGLSEIFQCKNDERLSLPGYHNVIVRSREKETPKHI